MTNKSKVRKSAKNDGMKDDVDGSKDVITMKIKVKCLVPFGDISNVYLT